MAIVGGGITGLTTAWHLHNRLGPNAAITLVEASGRLGGKIRTERLEGVPVEAGPDTFLARVPWAVDLARRLGLGDELVAPATGAAFICHRGRLLPLPGGTVLGVPVTARALLGTSLLSPAGRARAALDLVLPRRRSGFGTDPSVTEVIGSRLGSQALERLVEPLVGGINAGRADRLSLGSTARPLALAAEHHRSLILGLRADRRARADDAPVFLSVTGGLQRLVERLASSLDNVETRLGTAAVGLTAEGGRWRLSCDPGPNLAVDAVVVTVPAFAAAPLLAEASPEAADHLGRIRHASVVTATLAYRGDAVAAMPAGSGLLVPRSENRLLTACTFSTSKWPGLSRPDLVLLRASAGREGDDRACRLHDTALVARLHRELADLVGTTAEPIASRVDRWENGFPQYEPGHDERVQRIEAALARLGGIFVAGAGYRGVGIAACVQQAEVAAARVSAQLSHHAVPAGKTGAPS
ncbi:MAG: protoporphyrinogen oxidase [Actinomycetota bacterium]|nr:protoporphyrinogen oxidase [Actinomycetota bacterium]